MPFASLEVGDTRSSCHMRVVVAFWPDFPSRCCTDGVIDARARGEARCSNRDAPCIPFCPEKKTYTTKPADVEELHQWHVQKAEAHPCFKPVPQEEAVSVAVCTA